LPLLYRVKQTIDVAAGMTDDEDPAVQAAPAPADQKPVEAPAPDKPRPRKDGPPDPPNLRNRTFGRQMELDKERLKKLLKNASLTFSIELVGGHVVETDGRSHRNTVSVWTFPLEDLVDKKPTLSMEALFSSDPPPVVEEEEEEEEP
jgi:hypothetical protein